MKSSLKLSEVIILLSGCLLMGISINMFLNPHNIAPGGLTGVSIIINTLTGIPIWLINIFVDIPLFLFAFRILGKQDASKTLLGIIFLTLSLKLTENLTYVHITDDILLSSISGGIILGAALGLIFRINGSTGGNTGKDDDKPFGGEKYNKAEKNNDGTLNEFCKVDDVSYQGMDRLVARDKIVEQLRQKGLVEKIEDYDNEVGYSERTNEVIEPLLSKQWFVNMKPIVKELKAELAKKTTIFNFYPTRFKSTLNKWLDNLDDWCISRQLLWGHQLPVYYHKDSNKMYVGINPPVDYIQEQSVLDTWFSSGLWPIATTIKNHNPNVKNFYPTSVLVTAYDIIFFWVARMLFQCVNIKHQIPFNTVLVHGIIRDSQNRKMSKSLGNGINPLDLIEKYGADALRLFLIGSSTLGEDIRFNEERLTFYTNFLNKIWNAHNFLNGHESVLKVDAKSIDVSSLHPINKWILAKFNDLLKDVTKMFDKYNFAVLVKNLVTFIWDVYCNEYLELTHSLFSSKEYWKQTALVSHYIFKSLLIVLHPFAPFITEQLYLTMYKDKMSIMLETMPDIIKITGSKQSYNIDHFLTTIAKVRELRIKYKIKNSTIININLIIHNKVNEKMVKDLFMLQNIKVNEISNKRINEEWDIIETQDIIIEYLNEFVNKDEELARLLKQKQNLENEIKRSENILSNKNFIAKASKEKVESEKNKYEQYKKQYEIVATSIKRLQK